ncbi:uncharacterized protein FOMMEDRAFT_149168 [Fomitiporia mediterranea MF3/22]|uniref:uncharacterized protein n=1 Tax=Fomitiporia mediterranea (strain MF3/22) TaxID=694068 RepID=UPI00044084D9|nr:uncharacterized protein FOMMEDRAFT_149168 [Fomitiporia mediterranea MF3/22]EJC98384.1 hypothetical protein FOMMEDRAFT_149168 [Fomitiporia mediterranea MF3/22]
MSHLSAYLPDVELVEPGNSHSGSLAVLYNETWRTQDPYAVFTLLDVVRDRPEIRADAETADKVCVLQWLVDGEIPVYLRSSFLCYKVVVRRVYFDLLVWIWSYFGQGWGEQTGYKPDPKIGDALIFPLHNPFIGLNVVSTEQALKMGVVTTGTPGNASPRDYRFTFWQSKELRVKSVWCDLFDFREILEIRSVQLIPMPELKLQSFCNDYGPITRPAFMLADDPGQHERQIRANLSNIHWKELQRAISDLGAGFFDTKFSHNTIIARPMDNDRTEYVCEFASNKVVQIVIKHFKHLSHAKALKLYRIFLGSPRTRVAAGYLLETTAFAALQKGGYWRLHSMKKLPIGADKTKQYWGRHTGAPSFTLLTGHKGSSIKISKGIKTNYKQKDFAEVKCIDYNPSDTLPDSKSAICTINSTVAV